MFRIALLVVLSLPTLALAQFGSPREGNGFFGRRAPAAQEAPAGNNRELAQQPNIQFPQQQQRQQYQQQQQQQPPYNMQPAPPVPTSPPAAATPRPRRATSTPAPSRRSQPKEEEEKEKEPKAEKPKASASNDDLEKMVNQLDKDGKKAREAEEALAKAADEATTAVAGFLRAANDGVYSKASLYLTPEIQKYFDSEISAVNGTMKTVLDQLTRDGDIRSVTYSNATVRGEGAVVDAELTYGSGPAERRLFDLIKVKSDWKIVLPINPDEAASVDEAPAPPARPKATPSVAPPPAPTPAATPVANDTNTTGAAAEAAPNATGVAMAASPTTGTAPKPSALADAPWR